LISIIFHPDAEAELDHTVGFYEEQQPGLGLDFKEEVLYGISQIRDAPSRWPMHENGTQKFLLRRFPYYIFYLEQPSYLWIVAVAHCSRRPNYLKDRLITGT
jgi:toxin ParE1/3/4